MSNSEQQESNPGSIAHSSDPHEDLQLDLPSLSSFLNVDRSLLEGVNELLLAQINVKFNNWESLKAEKLIVDMNFEQFKHESSKSLDHLKKELNASHTKNLETEKLLQEEKESKDKLTTELESAKTNISNQEKVIANLKLQAETALDEKHSVFELLNSKQSQVNTLKAELDQLSSNNSSLRKQYFELENKSQSLTTELSRNKHELFALSQELELTKKNSEWYDSELSNKVQELKRLRLEKRETVSQLQKELDTNRTGFISTKAKYDSLYESYNKTATELDKALTDLKRAKDDYSKKESDFFKEMSIKDNQVRFLEESNENRKQRIDELDSIIATLQSEVDNNSSKINSQLEEKEKLVEAQELQIQQLTETIEDLTNQTEHSHGFLNENAQRVLKQSSSNLSLSQLYTDFQLMKKQLSNERRLKEKMQVQIDHFIEELSKKLPIIESTKEKCSLMENELVEYSILLEKTRFERDDAKRQVAAWNKSIDEYEDRINSLATQSADLKSQVSTLVAQISLKTDGSSPLTTEEKELIKSLNGKTTSFVNGSDTDKIISERLVKFKDINELVNKNAELIQALRELGKKLENQEAHQKANKATFESETLKEVRENNIRLEDELKQTQEKLLLIMKERDMFRDIHKLQGEPTESTQTSSQSEKEVVALTEELDRSRTELVVLKKESKATIEELNKQIRSLWEAKSDINLQLAKANSSVTIAEERLKASYESNRFIKLELDQIKGANESLSQSLNSTEENNKKLFEETLSLRSEVSNINSELRSLRSEKSIWTSFQERIKDENKQLHNEKASLNSLVNNLQLMLSERENSYTDSIKRLSTSLDSAEKELENAKQRIINQSTEISLLVKRRDSDLEILRARIDSLTAELSSTRESLIKETAALARADQTVELLNSQVRVLEEKIKPIHGIASRRLSATSKDLNTIEEYKEALEKLESDLEIAQQSADQFKNVAEAAEAELTRLGSSFDEYKNVYETKLKEYSEENGKLSSSNEDLKQSIEKVKEELQDSKTAWDEERGTLLNKITNLEVDASSVNSFKHDLEAKVELLQTELTQLTEESKLQNDDLNKTKSEIDELNKVNQELTLYKNSTESQITELTNRAETAEKGLKEAEISWENQRNLLLGEIKETKNKIDELNVENRMLLNQLESATDSTGGSQLKKNDILTGDNDNTSQLISFLRDQKDHVSRELQQSQMEVTRLRQQLSIAEEEIEQSKIEAEKLEGYEKLSNELQGEITKSAELSKIVSELRQGNTDLRNENQSQVNRITALYHQLEQEKAKNEPFEIQIKQLKVEVETKGKEATMNQEQLEYWKTRSLNLLNEVGSIGNEEYVKEAESLKEKLAEVEGKHSELSARFNRLKDEAQSKLKRRKEDYEMLRREHEELRKTLADTNAEVSSLTEKLNLSSKTSESLTQELEQLKSKQTSADLNSEKHVDELKKKQEEVERLLAENNKLKETQVQSPETSEEVEALKKELQEAKEAVKKASSQADKDDSTSIDTLKAKLAAEHEADVAARIAAAVEETRKKIRAPVEERIQSVINKRWNDRKKDLENEYQKRIAEASKKSETSGNVEALKKEYETKLEEVKIAAREEGRSAARKEAELRTNLLKRKAEKAEAELRKLKQAQEKVSSQPQPLPIETAVLDTATDSKDSNGTQTPTKRAAELDSPGSDSPGKKTKKE
ncbi:Myosin-like protein [Komagataella phaffii CBS 7435]|uniref:Myosin-like protein associated with the nuclear envelope n=2 Tax=Komagataella phaffii TaxID=460519 RepID=C4R7I3_KOMPG|nr:Myosin-like protein associated with the nuclear envelope [Komagataella phaffii GS115]AOA65352.1 GQ67_04653T0 [Komagataella phaffii]CAH2451068.1 Myosin-like protein [Komagataella phaffii CBS 7435]AOA69632.1 GQ68_04625T0 [Komagataella phaffii GS115]CAY71558.1 Myosin-like protein associated with the nuclear envelope [Komagataella phaffii GS115]CCA40836.1 Myosin-like protein [Komagataella phaffii CBS 7435]